MKRWGLLLLGAGAGTVAGALLGRPAILPALAVVLTGLLLLPLRGRSGGGDLVATATAAHTAGAGSATTSGRASVLDLGSRVETILGLAEEQAADHVAEAKATAARIVAQARADAERMKSG